MENFWNIALFKRKTMADVFKRKPYRMDGEFKMSRPKETDPQWVPVRIDTTVPYCFVIIKSTNKWTWAEIIRQGIDKMTQPTEQNQRIALLESRLNTALRMLEKKGTRIEPSVGWKNI